ncbi:hypothetical protein Tco_0772361 [Tanacetum coccineum]|uniref:DUF4219 domain-containing protein n=1 Tax=Tanacetum coccineum TaxID=301880 RepID=A0ABQ4ZL38_9ASTR
MNSFNYLRLELATLTLPFVTQRNLKFLSNNVCDTGCFSGGRAAVAADLRGNSRGVEGEFWALLSYKGSTDPKHLGPTSGIRATRGTLSKKNHKNNKHSLLRSRKMSHPADEFSQHLSDDDVSNHEDASDNGDATNKPKQQQLISTATTISNIKLPILKKEEYDIWAIEMEHYLEYIDNDVWKVIQNGNSKKRISTRKYGVIRVLSPVSAAEIHAVEKERKARTILLMAIPKEHLRRFHGMDDAKEIWEAIRTRFGGNANSKKMHKVVLK